MHFDYLRLLLASLVMFSHCFSLVGQADPLQRVTPFASLAAMTKAGTYSGKVRSFTERDIAGFQSNQMEARLGPY